MFTGGTAHAVVPLIPFVVPLATYLGASAELATAIDFSLVLHGAILAIALNKDTGAASSSTSGQLTVRLNPKNPKSSYQRFYHSRVIEEFDKYYEK